MGALNPATFVANLNGSVAATDQSGPTAFTENGSLRYRPADGARINWFHNSRGLVNANAWQGEAGAAIARVSGLSFPQLPAGVTTAIKATIGTNSNAEGLNLTALPLPVMPKELRITELRCSMYLWSKTPVTVPVFGFRPLMRGSGTNLSGGTGGVSCNLTTVPQKFTTLTVAVEEHETLYWVQLVARYNASSHAANEIYGTCAHLEFRSDIGDWFDADWLPGAQYMEMRNGRVGGGPDLPSVSRVVGMPEPEVRNLVPNPWCTINNTGWSATNGTHARDLTRSPYNQQGAITASGANARASINVTAAAGDHRALWLLTSRAAIDRTVQLYYNGVAIGATETLTRNSELIVSAPFTGTGGSAALGLEIVNSANGEVFAIHYAGAHPGLDDPAPCPDINLYSGGGILAGCMWDSTAHNSASTRADSRPTITPVSHLDIATGSIVYRWRKDHPVGNAHVLLSCGESGVGKDRFELRETADGHLQQAWISNNAGETVVTDLSVTFSQYESYDLYAEWLGTSVAVAVDQGARTFGVRNAPTGNLGAGLLRLGG